MEDAVLPAANSSDRKTEVLAATAPSSARGRSSFTCSSSLLRPSLTESEIPKQRSEPELLFSPAACTVSALLAHLPSASAGFGRLNHRCDSFPQVQRAKVAEFAVVAFLATVCLQAQHVLSHFFRCIQQPHRLGKREQIAFVRKYAHGRQLPRS